MYYICVLYTHTHTHTHTYINCNLIRKLKASKYCCSKCPLIIEGKGSLRAEKSGRHPFHRGIREQHQEWDKLMALDLMGHSENLLHLCDNPAKEAGNLKSQTNPSRGAFSSWFVTGLESLKEATSWKPEMYWTCCRWRRLQRGDILT